ncbi:MAG: DoxX family membrane protein [Desulfuromonadales bacterium]|nr:DoxX family membrane protein [Desulfuromonadales bacterium]
MARLWQDRELGLVWLRLGVGGAFIHFGALALLAGPARWARMGGVVRHLGISFFPEGWGFLLAFLALAGGVGLLLGFWFRPFCLILAIGLTLAAYLNWRHGGGGVEAVVRVLVVTGLLFTGPGRYGMGR